MALVTTDFFSEALEMGTSMNVVLPQPTQEQIGVAAGTRTTDFPVLYLLHGLSDDHSAWVRYTSIERYAAEAGLAVVMPAVARSFYADEVDGHAYWQFVSEELPQVVSRFFRVSPDPGETYVAGLSMGGYGAIKLALTHPGRYAGAASMSGALDVRHLAAEHRPELFARVFGDAGIPDSADPFALLSAADPAAVPPLHVSCGTEDERIIDGNLRFVAAALERGFDVTDAFGPGEHVWELWDRRVREVIAWLPGLAG